MTFFFAVLAIILCLAFAFSNGFNDSANAIATAVASRTLNPRKAIFVASFFEFIGAVLFGAAVANTIGSGIVKPETFSSAATSDTITILMIYATLLGSSVWIIFCTIWGFPISASHALIGGFIGAGVAAAGPDCVYWKSVMIKVVLIMITSPIIGFITGFLLTKAAYKASEDSSPSVVKKFRVMEVLSTVLFSISHGSNDGAKPMGLIIFTLGALNLNRLTDNSLKINGIPWWILVSVSAALTLGIMLGGKEVIKTIGRRVYKVKSLNSFAAEFGGAVIIYLSSFFGLPVSSSHIITTSVMGSGFAERPKKIGWMYVKNIVLAWIFTLPASAIISVVTFYILKGVVGLF